jgi:hypothetical protein
MHTQIQQKTNQDPQILDLNGVRVKCKESHH